jgi:phosphatidylethanolamine/phosphatidyl-N-methylethanolamine N-methyltransferase
MSEHGKFLANFLRNPTQVGAIAPSSQHLAAMMVDWIEWDRVKTVIEYGPGTGVFTEVIRQRCAPGSKFFAIERSPDLAAAVRKRCPGVTVYEDSVENVVDLCQRENITEVDAVICGLPWAAFPDPLQKSCLDSLCRILRPGGQFATFAYWQGVVLPAGMRFRKRMGEYFTQIDRSPTVWRNLPPAFVYRCRR